MVERIATAVWRVLGVIVFMVMFTEYRLDPFPDYLFLIPGVMIGIDPVKLLKK